MYTIYTYLFQYSSEIRGLCLMKLSSETLQNLPYLWNVNSQIIFFIFHFEQLFICNNGCPGLCFINCYKSKVAQNDKQKNLIGFTYSKIMANFEAFLYTISSSINLLFLKSVKRNNESKKMVKCVRVKVYFTTEQPTVN